MKAEKFLNALAIVCCVILSGCAWGWYGQNGYNQYQAPQNQVPLQQRSEEPAVMQMLPYKFGFHIPNTDKNFVIRKSGHDAETAYMVLNWVMEQRYPMLEVWMNSILQEKAQYGRNIKAYMHSKGYICLKEWYEPIQFEGVKDPKLYKMTFALNAPAKSYTEPQSNGKRSVSTVKKPVTKKIKKSSRVSKKK